MKKNLLLILMAFVSCFFTTSAMAQCDAEVSWVISDDGSAFYSTTPQVFCGVDVVELLVATPTQEDSAYALSANVGSFDLPEIGPASISVLALTDDDLANSGGTIEINLVGVNNTDCTATISATLEELGLTGSTVYDFCCVQPEFINANGAEASISIDATPFCDGEFLSLPLIAFGASATSFTLTTEQGIFNSTGDVTSVINYDGSSADIDYLLLDADAMVAIGGGTVTVTFTNDNDAACVGTLTFDLEGVATLDDYCNAVAPPSNDLCGGAIGISNGSNGPFTTTNATAGDDEELLATAGCYFGDDEFQTTIWFTFYGSGNDVTITTIDDCEGLSDTPNDDTQFAIYEGSCVGPEIGCNDDIDEAAGNYLAAITVPTTNGQLYYLLVDGYNGSDGDFCLQVEGAGEPCEVEEPTIAAASNSACQIDGEQVEIILGNAGSGSAGVLYMLTDFTGQQADFGIVAGPQISPNFNAVDLPAGELIGWAISAEDEILDTDGTIGGLQGCYSLSNFVLFTILEANAEGCVSATIQLDNVQAMNVFPQPATNQATLSLTTAKADNMNLQIVDLAGKVIAQRDIMVNAGENNIDLDINDFASGIYFVQVSNNEGLATAKLIKQ